MRSVTLLVCCCAMVPITAAAASACSRGWDSYDPRLTGGSGAGTATGTDTAGSGGTGTAGTGGTGTAGGGGNGSGCAVVGTFSNGYCYRREITIDHTRVWNSDQAQFPVLFSGTFSYLATRANGGRVESASGHDIVFAADSAGSEPLDHEVEVYDAPSGALVAWVKVPTVSSTFDTPIFVFYGNPTVSSSQQHVAGVWSASYVGVWHFAETSWTGSAGEVLDSVGNNSGTAVFDASSSADGKVFRGALFDANDDHVNAGTDATLRPTSVTVAAWAKPQSVGTLPDRHPYMVTQDTWRPDGSDPRGYYLEIFRTISSPSPTFYAANGSESAHAFAHSELANDVWYHVVGTHDASNGEAQVFVNGVSEGTATMSGGIDYDASKPVLIGGISDESWNGLLDEVRISNVSRTPDWIRTEYNSQSSPATFYAIGDEERPR